jgi:hypothetical protein
MIDEKIKKSLKANWGDKADSLDCYAEIRFFDPLSSWCCYIFAMNEDEDLIHCLIYSGAMGGQIYTLHPDFIFQAYNRNGEFPEIDKEFRRTKITKLLERLK